MSTTTHPFFRSQQVTVGGAILLATPTEISKPTTHKLETLRPKLLLPSRVVERELNAVIALKHIHALVVSKSVKRMGQTIYCVDIYYRETQSRIPVHRRYGPVSERARGAPSVTLELDFDEFVQLSHVAEQLTRLSHGMNCCAYCREMIFYNTTSDLKPRRNLQWFKSDRDVCETLTEYLTTLISLTVESSTTGDLCLGRKRVSRLLQLFLQTPESERHSI